MIDEPFYFQLDDFFQLSTLNSQLSTLNNTSTIPLPHPNYTPTTYYIACIFFQRTLPVSTTKNKYMLLSNSLLIEYSLRRMGFSIN